MRTLSSGSSVVCAPRSARQEQAALAYEHTALAALGDAERALGNYQFGLEAVARQQLALDATRSSYAHTKTRFEAGDIALNELLVEDRILRDVENAYVHTHTTAAIDLVALFKALGGGWDAQAAASEESP